MLFPFVDHRPIQSQTTWITQNNNTLFLLCDRRVYASQRLNIHFPSWRKYESHDCVSFACNSLSISLSFPFPPLFLCCFSFEMETEKEKEKQQPTFSSNSDQKDIVEELKYALIDTPKDIPSWIDTSIRNRMLEWLENYKGMHRFCCTQFLYFLTRTKESHTLLRKEKNQSKLPESSGMSCILFFCWI